MSLIKDLKRENKLLREKLKAYEKTDMPVYQKLDNANLELERLKNKYHAQLEYERQNKEFYRRMMECSDEVVKALTEQYDEFSKAQAIVDGITDIIECVDGVNEDFIEFVFDDRRFWITVLNKDFNGDFENDDPELKQYHLVQTTNDNINSDDKLEVDMKFKREVYF